MPGKLFIVSTPIGNLGDISHRAIEVLSAADLIACEDTRRTRKLLQHLGVRTRLVSYHEHNEEKRESEILGRLQSGESVALVSDAGTPCISDPGYRLVRAARSIGAKVTVIPGPTAFVAAVVLSGLPTDSIFFGGFLPSRSSQRRKRLEEVRTLAATLVFFEAPHRIVAALEDAAAILGNRPAAAVREITKLHEEVITGDLTSLLCHFRSIPPRGEFVLVFGRPVNENQPQTETPRSLSDRVKDLIATGLDRRAALKTAAKEFGLSRAEAYRQLQQSGE